MKTRGLLKVLPILLIAFKDKLSAAFRHEQIQTRYLQKVGGHTFGGCRDRNLGAIYIPRRKRAKDIKTGYQNCTFNKNR